MARGPGRVGKLWRSSSHYYHLNYDTVTSRNQCAVQPETSRNPGWQCGARASSLLLELEIAPARHRQLSRSESTHRDRGPHMYLCSRGRRSRLSHFRLGALARTPSRTPRQRGRGRPDRGLCHVVKLADVTVATAHWQAAPRRPGNGPVTPSPVNPGPPPARVPTGRPWPAAAFAAGPRVRFRPLRLVRLLGRAEATVAPAATPHGDEPSGHRHRPI